MNQPTYDQEAIYDSEIAPLMDQIIEVCKRAQIPMIATYCYRNTPERLSFCSTTLHGPHAWMPDRYRAMIDILVERTDVIQEGGEGMTDPDVGSLGGNGG